MQSIPTTAPVAAAVLPPLAVAMTAGDIRAHLSAIEAALGGKAEAAASVSTYRHRQDDVCVSVYPNGLTGDDRQYFWASDWPSAFAQAAEWVATHRVVARDNLIRRLALDIIDLTDQHGRCTATLLRGRGHSGADIQALSDAACQRASEMSGNAPFSVEG